MAIHKALESNFDKQGLVIYIAQRSEVEARATAEAIQSRGHLTQYFTEVEEAFAGITLRCPDLLLLDFPFVQSLLRRIRVDERFEALPAIVLLDEPANDEQIFETFHFGGDMVLSKPLSMEELFRILGSR